MAEGMKAPNFTGKDQNGKEYEGILRKTFVIGKDGHILKELEEA